MASKAAMVLRLHASRPLERPHRLRWPLYAVTREVRGLAISSPDVDLFSLRV